MAAVSASVTSPVMLGRDRESARLSEALGALSQGRGHLVVISGEAGIGKTRLINESVEQAGADVRVLRAECLALGMGVPYLPFAELLRDLQRQMSSHDLARVMGGARADLARFLPEVAVWVQPDGETAEPVGRTERPRSDELERLRLYETFLRLAERVAADVPTAFVVEDVQWIDRASLELLAFMAHGLAESAPSMLVVSVRPEEAAEKEQVLALLAQLGRARRAVHIELGPLDADSTRRLASAVLGRQPEDELVERIQRLSDGNPLFAEELLAASLRRGSESTLPPKLRDLLAARLAQVPGRVMEVLRIAAASGRSVDDQLLARISGLDEDDVGDAVRHALDDHILLRSARPGDAGYRFRHEIMRELVASQLLPDQARRIHAAYAEALVEVPPARRSLTEIAQHWEAAGEVDRALAAHIEAGQAAAAKLAYGEALDHDERALQLWHGVEHAEDVAGEPLTTLLEDTASAAARDGAFGRAIELTRKRLEQRDSLARESFELARSSLRWYLWEAGDLEGALSEAEAVLSEPAVLPDRWRANALVHGAGLLLYLERTQRAGNLAREALDVAREAGAVEEQAMATGVLGWCLLLEGDVDAGLDALGQVVEDAHRLEGQELAGRYPVYSALAHTNLSVALELVGRLEEAHATAIEGVAAAKRQGVSRTFGSILQASAARALYQLGRWDEATAEIDVALDAGAVGPGRVSLLALRALVAVGRGRPAEAEATLADAEMLVDDDMPIDVRRWLTAAVAEYSIWQGDSATALTRMALLMGEADPSPVATPGARPAVRDASIPYLMVLGARAAADVALTERATGVEAGPSTVAVSRLQSAMRRAERRRALATAWAGALAVAKAELDRAIGAEAATRVRHWKTAVKRAEGCPYLDAYARWRLAEAQLADRDGRHAAAETIGGALDIAESMGAARLQAELVGLAQRARLSIVDSGEGRLVTPSGRERPFGLTARELEVLGLLADGLDNREIAERLYISPKTASVHVSNIYGKLGVESRVAAATTAHSLGLAGTPEDPSDKHG